MHASRTTVSRHSRCRRLLQLPAALLFILLLAACGRADAPALTTPVPTFPPAARTRVPTYTPGPTATPIPSATVTAAPTEVPSSATPAPDPTLSQVKLVGLSWLEKYKYNLLLSFDFPGPVEPADYRVTLEGKQYYCETLPQYPNRLYCNGQGAKVLATALVQIYPAGSNQPGFEQEVWVPYFNQ